jgi:hypothetical protein
MITLTDDDRLWLDRWRVGCQPGMDWLASSPAPERVRAMLVKMLDRYGSATVFARVLADHLGADPCQVYAENWPRRAAKYAADCRERGQHPHADKLQAALISLMFCANCGRPLADPVSVGRGIGPDCWPKIDPQWRAAITMRLAGADRHQAGPVAPGPALQGGLW